MVSSYHVSRRGSATTSNEESPAFAAESARLTKTGTPVSRRVSTSARWPMAEYEKVFALANPASPSA